MGSDKKKWAVFGIVFVVSVVLDQYTKLLAVNHLKGKRAIDLVENYARLVYAENPGAFLGLGGNWPDSVRFAVFIVLAVVLLVGVLVYLVKKRDVTMWAAIGLSLFASGALGNVIDRVAREGGRVVDFMQLSLKRRRRCVKLALIGDVHQEDIALDIVLEHIRERDLIDAIWCVGDLAHGEGDFFRTCELLMKHEVVTVLGNHDRWFLDEEGGDLDERSRVKNIDDVYAYLLSLSETHRVKSVHGDIVLAHGVGRDDMTRISFDASPYDFQQHQEFQRLKNEKCYASVGGHVRVARRRRAHDKPRVDGQRRTNPRRMERARRHTHDQQNRRAPKRELTNDCAPRTLPSAHGRFMKYCEPTRA